MILLSHLLTTIFLTSRYALNFLIFMIYENFTLLILILSTIFTILYKLGLVKRFVWITVENELRENVFNGTKVSFGNVEIDYIRGQCIIHDFIVHQPKRDEWKWDSPIFSRIGQLYVEFNMPSIIVNFFLSYLTTFRFNTSWPPGQTESNGIDIYTIHVSNVQIFVERKYHIFNFYLLDKSMCVPDASDFETEHGTEDDDNDNNNSLQQENQEDFNDTMKTLVAAANAEDDNMNHNNNDAADNDASATLTKSQAHDLVNDLLQSVNTLGRAAITQSSMRRSSSSEIDGEIGGNGNTGRGGKGSSSSSSSLISSTFQNELLKTKRKFTERLKELQSSNTQQKIQTMKDSTHIIKEVSNEIYTKHQQQTSRQAMLIKNQQKYIQQQYQQDQEENNNDGENDDDESSVPKTAAASKKKGDKKQQIELNEGPPTLYVRIGRIVFNDMRVWTKDNFFQDESLKIQKNNINNTSYQQKKTNKKKNAHSCLEDNDGGHDQGEEDEKNISSSSSSWNKPMYIKELYFKSSELCPALSSIDKTYHKNYRNRNSANAAASAVTSSQNNSDSNSNNNNNNTTVNNFNTTISSTIQNMPSIYQPIEKIVDVVMKKVLAECTKNNSGIVLQTAIGEVLDFIKLNTVRSSTTATTLTPTNTTTLAGGGRGRLAKTSTKTSRNNATISTNAISNGTTTTAARRSSSSSPYRSPRQKEQGLHEQKHNNDISGTNNYEQQNDTSSLLSTATNGSINNKNNNNSLRQQQQKHRLSSSSKNSYANSSTTIYTDSISSLGTATTFNTANNIMPYPDADDELSSNVGIELPFSSPKNNSRGVEKNNNAKQKLAQTDSVGW